jgi:hypothetical protein
MVMDNKLKSQLYDKETHTSDETVQKLQNKIA